VKSLIVYIVTSIFTSRAFWSLRRFLFALGRQGRRRVIYFHQADDPYSHLAVQVLAMFRNRYDIDLVPMLVGPPPDSAAPERDKLRAYARLDSARLAQAHGLDAPTPMTQPSAELLAQATQTLAKAITNGRFVEDAPAISAALWRGDGIGAQTIVDAQAMIQAGNEKRERLGHYLGAMFYFEGEFYWGIDRLHYLEARLGRKDGIIPPRETQLGPVRNFKTKPVIDFWFSIRSPYSWLSFPILRKLAQHYGAELKLNFVLPMVMRGLAVPPIKSRYITFDTIREAQRLGIGFGPIVDPVGLGAERALAVLHHAVPLRRGEAFAEAALAGCWSRGIDLATDKGLRRIAREAGLDDDLVDRALADDSWRQTVAAHRQALFDSGLWGVPSFRVNGRPAHWGRDRIWMLEQDLLNEAE
jgi:2-hydroxychromene-2-carboxylate isomerase